MTQRHILALLLTVPLLGAAAPADAPPVHVHYVSQRGALAYLREGPGYAYKILWVYRHRGYPFQVTAGFDIWRRVRDPGGTIGWMSASMLSDSRTVLIIGKGRAQIRASDTPDAKVVGLADPDAIIGLKACSASACHVHGADMDGWIARDRIWGVDPGETFK